MSRERLATLRSGGVISSGVEKDVAALCLLRLGVPPENLRGAPPAPGAPGPPGAFSIKVEFVKTAYKVAPGGTSGFFKTGQNADILLSGVDFNNTGGPLLFNHNSGIATDGTRLVLADTFNNRILIWNTLPTGNVPPDLVLGQKDFFTNNPGVARDQMDWPISVSTDGQRLVVADTYNDRILVWNAFPTRNGQPADLVLQGELPGQSIDPKSKSQFGWPWGVWTDGQKLVVISTAGGRVLIWSQFPTRDNQPADTLLTGGGKLGTPRQVTSDGRSLIIGDHNARVEGQSERGSFFWKTFPTADEQPFDFYMPSGLWLRGDFTEDGKLVLMGDGLHIWNSFPQNANDAPDLIIGQGTYNFQGGDYTSVAVAGSRLYISSGNSNKVLVYNSIPTRPDQRPDFAIGSPDIGTNTLDTHFFIQNGVPASNGKSLFVSSDFDRKLYVWRNLPDQSGAHPDIVYHLAEGYWDNALWGDTFALAGKQSVLVWKTLPLSGEPPDLVFWQGIGSVRFQALAGVALDNRYFYLADAQANKVYVWEGLPTQDSAPKYTLDIATPRRLDSDGAYLLVTTTFDQAIQVFRVATLSSPARPISVGGRGRMNLPESAAVASGHLFISDTVFSRVLVWRNIEDALSGKWPPDVVLGKSTMDDRQPQIGRERLFWPGGLSFDGTYLWVGEFKFSTRLLRFSPTP